MGNFAMRFWLTFFLFIYAIGSLTIHLLTRVQP
jgi:hypothetical protein